MDSAAQLMVSAFLTTFLRALLRRRDVWILLACWAAVWYGIAWLAPVGVVDVTSAPVALLYQVAYLACLCGGAAALHFLERFDQILRRIPSSRRWLAALASLAILDAVAFLVACAACFRHVSRVNESASVRAPSALWVASVAVVLGTSIACAPALRGVRAWIYAVALFAIVCVIAPPPSDGDDVRGNFELVSRLMPILGLCLILALVTRSAGSTR